MEDKILIVIKELALSAWIWIKRKSRLYRSCWLWTQIQQIIISQYSNYIVIPPQKKKLYSYTFPRFPFTVILKICILIILLLSLLPHLTMDDPNPKFLVQIIVFSPSRPHFRNCFPDETENFLCKVKGV